MGTDGGFSNLVTFSNMARAVGWSNDALTFVQTFSILDGNDRDRSASFLDMRNLLLPQQLCQKGAMHQTSFIDMRKYWRDKYLKSEFRL
jgi:hypothetical protein